MQPNKSAGALALAVLAFGLFAVASPVRAQESDSLTRDLDACRALVKKRSWKKSIAAFETLFEKHEGDARLAAEREDIERDLQLSMFNLGRRPPTGEALFGPAAKKFSASSGTVEFVFDEGTSDPMWTSWTGGLKMLPARFDDSFVVTVPAEGRKAKFEKLAEYEHAPDRVRVRAVLAYNLENDGGYLVTLPYTPDHSDSDHRLGNSPSNAVSDEFRAFKLSAGGSELLGREYWWRKRNSLYEYCRWARVTRKGSTIKLEAEACRSFVAKDGEHESGFIALDLDYVGGYPGPISVRVTGKLDRRWLEKKIAQHEDAAFAEWKAKEYDVVAALPEWMRNASSVTTTSTADLPGDLPEALQDEVRSFLDGVFDGSVAPDAQVPSVGAQSPAAQLLIDGVLHLAHGAPSAAEARFTQLLEVAPDFHAAYLWRARARLMRRAVAEADADLEAAAEQQPASPRYLELRARLQLVRGDLEAARDTLSGARAAGVWTEKLSDLSKGVTAALRGPEWKRTYRTKTLHFEILSDHSSDVCRDVGKLLQSAVSLYVQDLRPLPADRQPARVFVFSSRDGYLKFSELLGAQLAHSAGAYLPKLHILVIWMPTDRRDFEATVRHEGFHQYVHHFAEALPPWLNEGWAEYFGNVPREDKIVGHQTDTAALVKRLPETFPLKDVMQLSKVDFMADAGTSYVRAWAAVAFLNDSSDARVRGLLEAYFDELVSGSSAEEAYAAVFADREAETQAAFAAYLHGLYRMR